jgi:hypothetical protein
MYLDGSAGMKVDLTAQYVRVQLAGTNYLSLAEVRSRTHFLSLAEVCSPAPSLLVWSTGKSGKTIFKNREKWLNHTTEHAF